MLRNIPSYDFKVASCHIVKGPHGKEPMTASRQAEHLQGTNPANNHLDLETDLFLVQCQGRPYPGPHFDCGLAEDISKHGTSDPQILRQ